MKGGLFSTLIFISKFYDVAAFKSYPSIVKLPRSYFFKGEKVYSGNEKNAKEGKVLL
jgi:hypothetical protein